MITRDAMNKQKKKFQSGTSFDVSVNTYGLIGISHRSEKSLSARRPAVPPSGNSWSSPRIRHTLGNGTIAILSRAGRRRSSRRTEIYGRRARGAVAQQVAAIAAGSRDTRATTRNYYDGAHLYKYYYRLNGGAQYNPTGPTRFSV